MNSGFEKQYKFQSLAREVVGAVVASIAVAALAGFGLSFTALSPLMVGCSSR